MSASSETAEQYWSWTKPEITSLNKPFWDGLRRRELLIQRCKKCGEYQWYARANCIHCGSRELEWVKSSGKGKIYSYTVINMVVGNSPIFNKELPYAVALVELDEGPRMYAMMTDCYLSDVKIDIPVEVVFKDVAPDLTIPMFRPVKSQE
ncbi:MAG: Zn-ribbon domain-containing OB-fold protein [Nitrososphaerales archaeon]